jgi:hypothetical protein
LKSKIATRSHQIKINRRTGNAAKPFLDRELHDYVPHCVHYLAVFTLIDRRHRANVGDLPEEDCACDAVQLARMGSLHRSGTHTGVGVPRQYVEEEAKK